MVGRTAGSHRRGVCVHGRPDAHVCVRWRVLVEGPVRQGRTNPKP